MKTSILFILFLISSNLYAQQNAVYRSLKLIPTTLPATCTYGDIRIGASSDLLSVCQTPNIWSTPLTSQNNLVNAGGDILYSTNTSLAFLAAGTSGQFLRSGGSNAPSWGSLTPHITKYTGGSGTFTPNSLTIYMRVRLVGGGGGGGAGTVAAGGGTGGNTTFSGSSPSVSLTGNGGTGGNFDAAGGSGGSSSITGAANGFNINGSDGTGAQLPGGGSSPSGGSGGNTPFGGGGGGGRYAAGAGIGQINSGGGGGGGGGSTSLSSASGGGSGGYVEAYITNLSASYAYAVGSAGTQATGGNLGAAGGSGVIIIEEYY